MTERARQNDLQVDDRAGGGRRAAYTAYYLPGFWPHDVA